MVVKERIVVDLAFENVDECVEKVKEWFKGKKYKKFTSRNPDRWSKAVVLEGAKSGMFSKKDLQLRFKSYAAGNSIMIEFLGSHDGSGVGSKPITSRERSPKDKPYENLANELARFVKGTWKREQGDPTAMPPTIGTGAGPGDGTSTGAYQTTQTGHDMQGTTGQGYGYDQGTGYQQDQSAQQWEQQDQSPQQWEQQDQSAQQWEQQDQSAQQWEQQDQLGETGEEQTAEAGTDVSGAYMPSETDAGADAGATGEGELTEEEAARLEEELADEVDEPQDDTQVGEASDAGSDTAIPTDTDEGTAVQDETTGDVTDVPPDGTVESPTDQSSDVPLVTEEGYDGPAHEETGVQEETAVGGEVSEDADVPEGSFCPGCGKETKPRWKTCPYCEKELKPKEDGDAEESGTREGVSEEELEEHTHTQGEVTASCPVCPGCGQSPTWIDEYDRYYCYSCEKYV